MNPEFFSSPKTNCYNLLVFFFIFYATINAITFLYQYLSQATRYRRYLLYNSYLRMYVYWFVTGCDWQLLIKTTLLDLSYRILCALKSFLSLPYCCACKQLRSQRSPQCLNWTALIKKCPFLYVGACSPWSAFYVLSWRSEAYRCHSRWLFYDYSQRAQAESHRDPPLANVGFYALMLSVSFLSFRLSSLSHETRTLYTKSRFF